MINTQIRDIIIDDLGKLPIDLQKKVQDFVHALIITLPKGVTGNSLLEFGGTLSKSDADNFIKVIEEGCEKVDTNEWESIT